MIKIRSINLVSILFFLLCLSASTWVLPSDDYRIFIYRASIISILFLNIFVSNITLNNTKLTFLMLSCLLFIISYNIFHAAIATSILGMVAVLSFIFLKSDDYEVIFIFVVRGFSFIFFIGLILYFLYLTDLVHPTAIINPLNPLKIESGITFKYIYGLLVITSDPISDLYRFQSIFDEPGVVGTICGLMTIAIQNTKMRYEKVVFYFSGVLSFSTAFFVFAFASLIMSGSFKTILKTTLSACFSIIIIIFFIPKNVADSILWIFENKSKLEDNRISSCFWDKYNQDMVGDNLWLGMGEGASMNLGCDVSSVITFVYDYGYIGIVLIFFIVFIVYFTMYLEISKNSFNSTLLSHFFIWMLFISVNFYQRPSFLYPLWIIIGAGYLITSCKNTSKKLIFDKGC